MGVGLWLRIPLSLFIIIILVNDEGRTLLIQRPSFYSDIISISKDNEIFDLKRKY